MRSRVFLSVFLLSVVLLPHGTPIARSDPLPVKRSSSGIAITADGATLLVVNPESNSLTLVDTASHSVIAELNEPRLYRST